MERITKDMLDLKISLGQVLAGIAVTTSVVVYVHTSFLTKNEGKELEARVFERISRMERQQDQQMILTSKIAVDVSYIKGKLEPKSN
jgi:hypothetical protein